MSWFSKEEDYSIHDNGFYGEPEIIYGSTEDDSSDSTPGPQGTGGWDDFQHEYISSCWNDNSR